MNKPWLVLIFSILYPAILYGQIQKVRIAIEDTTICKLSEISDKVIPVILSEDIGIQGGMAYSSGEFIYIAGKASVSQLDYSGQVLRKIEINAYVVGLTGDPVKKELYVVANGKLFCYDYAGKLKNTCQLTNGIVSSCFYHQGRIWLLSAKTEEGVKKKAVYQLSYVDGPSGKEKFLPFEYKEEISSIYANSTFSLYQGKLCFILKRIPEGDNDIPGQNKMWKIDRDQVVPLCEWSMNANNIINVASGFIGKYRFLQYVYKRKWYVYLTDQKNGKSICSRGITDDIYQTGTATISSPINEDTYLFVKEKAEMSPDALKKLGMKSKVALFIVKVKK